MPGCCLPASSILTWPSLIPMVLPPRLSVCLFSLSSRSSSYRTLQSELINCVQLHAFHFGALVPWHVLFFAQEVPPPLLFVCLKASFNFLLFHEASSNPPQRINLKLLCILRTPFSSFENCPLGLSFVLGIYLHLCLSPPLS